MSTVRKDFEVTIKLRNNQLKARRKERGLSILALCKVAGISTQAYTQLEGLRTSPVYEREHLAGKHRTRAKTGWQKGDWRPVVLKLAEFYDCQPEDLFPDAVRLVKKNEIVATFGLDQLPQAAVDQMPSLLPSPEDALASAEARVQLNEALSALTPTEQAVLTLRYGLDGEGERTLDEVGQIQGKTRERIRQIETRTIKKLRHPGNTAGAACRAFVADASPRELSDKAAAEYEQRARGRLSHAEACERNTAEIARDLRALPHGDKRRDALRERHARSIEEAKQLRLDAEEHFKLAREERARWPREEKT